MTKTKKVVALVLAFLMVFSSVSVLASAADENGSELAISAQFYKEVDGTWVTCDKVLAGDDVKVRVSVSTDYYTNGGSLLFFYDNAFFADEYEDYDNALTINSAYPSAADFADSYFDTDCEFIVEDLVTAGCITSAFAAAHNCFAVELAGPFTNYQYDDSAWMFEFDLSVLSSAEGEGEFLVSDGTILSPTNGDGYINVPKGEQNGNPFGNESMALWTATWNGCSDTVTTNSAITLDPNGGKWADNTTAAKTFNGQTGETFSVPTLTYTGKTLTGWYDAVADTAYGPEGPGAYSADVDLTLTAQWTDQIVATFSYNYEGSPAAVVDSTATPGYAVGYDLNGTYIVPTVPTRSGYEFRGWATSANESAQSSDLISSFAGMTYGDTGVNYYMIWAKSVTMTFVDSYDSSTLDTITGYAGDTITATLPTAPNHTGYDNANGTGNFDIAVPSVFPANDTTYTAYYDPKTVKVNYVITDGKGGSTVYSTSVDVSYDSEIPTEIYYTAPYGKTLNGWFTDAACNTALADNAVLSALSLTVYGYLDATKYDVKFMDGETQVGQTQSLAVGEAIVLPTAPTKTGYVFAGWTPSVGAVLDTAGDKTFYATWDNDPTLKEIFISEGETFAEIPNEAGADFEIPDEPYKEGYSFDGWSLTAGGAVVTLPATMPTSSTTYYAVFSANDYTATFNLEGGNINGDTSPVETTVTFGDAITAPSDDPVKSGYVFGGWSRTQGATEADESLGNMDSESGVDFYAVWTVDSFTLTVTYVMSDGTTAPQAFEDDYDYNANYSVTSPTVTGYTADILTVSGVMPAEDKEVTVTYTPNTYVLTVNYVMEDGAAAPASKTRNVKFNETYSVASDTVAGYTPDQATVTGTMDDVNGKTVTVTYSLNSYTLTIHYVYEGGASAQADYTDTVEYKDSYSVVSPAITGYTPDQLTVAGTMPADDKEITVTYSIVKPGLTITYIYDNGTSAATQYTDSTLAYGATYSVTSPAITGYTPDQATVAGTMGTDPVAVTVVYTANAHTITWIVDGVTIKTDNVHYGDAITAPTDPEKEGYTFDAWTPAVAATVADQDYTYTATWDINSYEFKIQYQYANGDQAKPDYTATIDYNGEYSIASPAITGYTPDIATVAGNMPAEDTTIVVTYTINSYELTIHYEYSDGDTAKPDYTDTVDYNEAYSVNSPVIEGYTPDIAVVAGTMGTDAVEVTVTYEINSHNVVIHYVYADNTPVNNGDDDIDDELDFGDEYSYTSPTVTGYTPDQATVAGTLPDDDVEVTVTYTINSYALTIHYEYSDGGTAKPDYTDTLDYNETYSVNSPVIEGYTPDEATVTGTMGTEAVEVFVTYEINSHNVIIHYVYADNSTAYTGINDELDYGDEYSYTSPSIPGYTPDQATVAGTLPDDDVEVTVTYTANNYTLTIHYQYANGDEAKPDYTAQVAYNEDYSVTSPAIDNYTASPAVVEGTMVIDGVEVTVTYSLDAVEIEFRAPVRITGTTDYGKLDYDNCETLNSNTTYAVGAALTAPDADTIEYYNFIGWTEDEVTGVVTDGSAYSIATVPATASAAKVYYAVYEREAVYLTVKDSTKASIDRRGNQPGTWGDTFTEANFTIDNYKSATTYTLWFVHVTPNFRVTSRSNPYTDTFFDVNGDGEITVVQGSGGYGTGSLVKVTDKVTGEVVEEFYVVIYGDVDGNTQINVADRTAVINAYQGKNNIVWASRNNYDQCKMMAANLNTPNRFALNLADYTALANVLSGKSTLNPLTGVVS